MIPRKQTERNRARHDRFICRGRVEHGLSYCSQPSVRREAIDEPLLAKLLDSYVDLEGTRQRIAQRASSALAAARDQLEQRDREAASAEAKLARVRSHYQEGRIEPEDWAEKRPQLTAELEAAQEAAERAQDHVQQVEQSAVPDDGEQALLEHLARLKQAVNVGVGGAPDLHALRNVIADMFESITLVRSGTWPKISGEGMIPWHDDVPTVTDDGLSGHGQKDRGGLAATGCCFSSACPGHADARTGPACTPNRCTNQPERVGQSTGSGRHVARHGRLRRLVHGCLLVSAGTSRHPRDPGSRA
jgi:hypothetical protein